MPDVGEDIGHTLVHYLSTGTYHTLELHNLSEHAMKVAEYNRSVRLYCVTKKYGLSGLEQLSKHYAEIYNKEISLLELLDVAEEAFQSLLDDEVWFTDCLKKKMTAAFEEDKSLFTKPIFLDHIGNVKRFDKALVKCIAEIYAEMDSPTQEPCCEVEAHLCLEEEPVLEELLCSEEPTVDHYAEEPLCPEQHPCSEEPADGPCAEEPLSPVASLTLQELLRPEQRLCPEEPADDHYAEGPRFEKEFARVVEPASLEDPHFGSLYAAYPSFRTVNLRNIPLRRTPTSFPKIYPPEASDPGISEEPKEAQQGNEVKEPGFLEPPEVFCARTSSKKGKKKKLRSKYSKHYSPSPPVPPPVPEIEIAAPTSLESPLLLDEPDVNSKILADGTSTCTSRAMHLQEDDHWRTCASCCAFIEGLAERMARTGFDACI